MDEIYTYHLDIHGEDNINRLQRWLIETMDDKDMWFKLQDIKRRGEYTTMEKIQMNNLIIKYNIQKGHYPTSSLWQEKFDYEPYIDNEL